MENIDWSIVRQKYKIKDLIGSGSYGQVYRAKHRDTGTQVALKIINGVFDSDLHAKNVYREISILK